MEYCQSRSLGDKREMKGERQAQGGGGHSRAGTARGRGGPR